MTLIKYRMIIGEGYIETTSLEEAESSGYEYTVITEEIINNYDTN